MKHENKTVELRHHGAVDGVTGSCHQLLWDEGKASLLVDCGLFQGAETSPQGAHSDQLAIDFEVQSIEALLVTHCHIDHVGRIPDLLAAGFKGKIYCTLPTAKLLPLVLEDAFRIGVSRNLRRVHAFLKLLKGRLVGVPYQTWTELPGHPVRFRFQPAGHILGSSYIECRVKVEKKTTKVLFSGDLGAPHSPLLGAPKPPYGTDILIIESTYGDRLHESRKHRHQRLQRIIERCFENRGTVLIPSFSIGRTQELLYELEHIIHRFAKKEAATGIRWEEMDIIVDSPLAHRFTQAYEELKPYWDREARQKFSSGRHPLSFEQLLTVDSHQNHLKIIEYLKKSGRPAIVIAASGMCAGGRIVNYLKGLLGDPKTDILFVGFQAKGTPGRTIQTYGPSQGYVKLEGVRYAIRAGIHTLRGYSAHADQADLLRFVQRMRKKPALVRIVHGDSQMKRTFKQKLESLDPAMVVEIPQG